MPTGCKSGEPGFTCALCEHGQGDLQDARERAHRSEREEQVLKEKVEQLTRDCLTLTYRLMGEPGDTLSPEAVEVMGRWGERALAAMDAVAGITRDAEVL